MKTVAIQGIRGSYSEEAALAIAGRGVSVLECKDFESTFESVRSGSAGFAVVPVENKIVGDINAAVSLLRESELRVLDEITLRIDHILAGTTTSEFETLTSVRSHIEALRQCGAFLDQNPSLTKLSGSDTASSVKGVVSDGDPLLSAICSRRAAELYGAKILRENISDDIDNWTKFYLIGN